MKPYLADVTNTMQLLKRHELEAKKAYGQNFLVSDEVLRRIVACAGIGKDDTVLEIGPGIGTLTQYLAEAAGRVLAVEVDRRLEPVLAESLAGFDNVQLCWADFLKLDPDELLQNFGIQPPVKVAANLPYYITTPILMKLLARPDLFSSLTLMVQEEVGERMAASPGGKEYGVLSLSVQYYADPELMIRVPASAFYPQPKVSSAVVRLRERKAPRPACRDTDYLFAIIKGAFLQRRKTLPNALAGYPPAGVGRDQTAAALEKMGLDPLIRGERLSLEEFARLSDLLKEEQKETAASR